MGPIQIFLLGFEDLRATGRIADELRTASGSGAIRVVDACFLLRESAHDVAVVRLSDLDDARREDLRAAASALVGLGAGAVFGTEIGAAGSVLAADAALDIDEFGTSAAEISHLAEELAIGDALLLLVIENVWAAGFADALREADVVFAQHDYLSAGGLVALGALLGLDVALDR